MFIFQRCFRQAFRIAQPIPNYKPIERPIPKDIETPKRPALDPNNPDEQYEIMKMPEFIFREEQEKKSQVRSYPGTQYVRVHKNGTTYHLFDASRISYGKMIGRIAQYLNGKHKPIYRYNEPGFSDKVVVVNASNMYLTGKKLHQKVMTYHTGFVGHLRQVKFEDMIVNKPEQLVAWSVSKMMPKNRLRWDKLDNLYVFRGREHNFKDILPQILPHRVDFEYQGNLYQDIAEGEGTIQYTTTDLNDPAIKENLKNYKVNLIKDEDLDDESFIPLSERNMRVKAQISQKQYEKLVRRRKKIMNRYKRLQVKKVKEPIKGADPNKSYLITSIKQMKKLRLMHIQPDDDAPDMDEEMLKM